MAGGAAEVQVKPVPCASCPYRRGVPSGIWSREEYEKLRKYDGSIVEQALKGAQGLFMCHQGDDTLCAGWAGCHDMANTFAARIHSAELDDSVWEYECQVPLFGSAAEAADHGEREIEDPSDKAMDAIEKIIRVRDERGRPVR